MLKSPTPEMQLAALDELNAYERALAKRHDMAIYQQLNDLNADERRLDAAHEYRIRKELAENTKTKSFTFRNGIA